MCKSPLSYLGKKGERKRKEGIKERQAEQTHLHALYGKAAFGEGRALIAGGVYQDVSHKRSMMSSNGFNHGFTEDALVMDF